MVASAQSRVVIVGGGVGGLSAAIDLASSGVAVTLLERASSVGGKLRSSEIAGLRIDVGPTVLTMRWAFDELFARANRRLDDYVTLDRADVLARHAWSKGRTLDLFSDPIRSRTAIADAFGPTDAEGFDRFCADTRRIYETVQTAFLRSPRPTIGTMLSQAASLGFRALASIDAHHTMWRSLDRYFRAPELKQLFGRYATYCGSSPFDAPATLNLISHVEAQGVWRVRGGMVQMGKALEKLARELGVEIITNAYVQNIEVRNGHVSSVFAADRAFAADAVVVNGDVSAVGAMLREPRKAPSATPLEDRSLSAVTCAAVAKTDGFALVHHNVFFSDDYALEFRQLFAERRVPEQPTVYLCAQDRADVAIDSQSERLFLIVNAPASGDAPARWTEKEVRRCEEAAILSMERCGLSLTVRASEWTTPPDFEARFPRTGGALYGPAARNAFSSFSREGSTTKIAGLYLAGGSVHPGPGVPMASLSGQLAATRVKSDLDSIARSRRAATSGSTSTA